MILGMDVCEEGEGHEVDLWERGNLGVESDGDSSTGQSKRTAQHPQFLICIVMAIDSSSLGAASRTAQVTAAEPNPAISVM
jgi:hypothetical protein